MGAKSKLMPNSKCVTEIMPVELFDKIVRINAPDNVSPTLFICWTYTGICRTTGGSLFPLYQILQINVDFRFVLTTKILQDFPKL